MEVWNISVGLTVVWVKSWNASMIALGTGGAHIRESLSTTGRGQSAEGSFKWSRKEL